ncbi:MAG: aminoacyl-tRNA hydrolase [Lactobacillus sp.]
MKLIAGLGNPGAKYDRTKHNTGFMALDHYLKAKNLTLNKNKFEGLWVKDGDTIYVEPQTYMNDSGRCVAQLAKFFKIAPADILIVHDDMDLPLAKLRVRAGGKSGGHNGIRSIIACLGRSDFNRLKIGIRHPRKTTVVSWVLTPFDDQQQKLMDQAFDQASQAIADFVSGHDAQYLMNKYN